MVGPVVFACDDGYAMPLATALRSIVEANRSGGPIEFHVLFDKFSERAKGKVLDSLPTGTAVINWVPVDSVLIRNLKFFTTLPK